MNAPEDLAAERESIAARYARRRGRDADPLDPWLLLARQDVERAIVHRLRREGREPARLRLLDVGCGGGWHLQQFLRMGFLPDRLVGCELLPERLAAARAVLPPAVRLEGGDALERLPGLGQFDVVFQSLVFSSILDPGFQEELARRLWAAVKPGGAVLWYDFVYDNPRNRDVAGVSRSRVRALFPAGRPSFQRITLAPPIGRPLARIGRGGLYRAAHALPFLRTHVLAWIPKAPEPS